MILFNDFYVLTCNRGIFKISKMIQKFKFCCLFVCLLPVHSYSAFSQKLNGFIISGGSGLGIGGFITGDSVDNRLEKSKPLYSFVLNQTPHNSNEVFFLKSEGKYSQEFEKTVKVTSAIEEVSATGMKGEIIFENTGSDTISINNVVPFGEDATSVYITGKGPWDLAKAWLFRPGFRPVRVILPDNAWELGYSSFPVANGMSVCALARRTRIEGGQRQRYETILPPGTKVAYTVYSEIFNGEWQNGLRRMFRDRHLHDVENFDNSLFEREDLKWIKECYLIVLQMGWDREFYDRLTGKYTYPEVIKKGIGTFGKIDVYGIWPTWPRLGLDQRNQWDLYRDLPGGTDQLRSFIKMSQQAGTKFFIAYNPWDNSTRKEDHYKGMARLISETEADGVVLDTKGSSSYELQAAADSVRMGVVMYSEGMAVTKDMPGIISGRVHNAIFMSPELNLNKLIKPDFSIFRVCDVGEDFIHREVAVSFFNGYGTELNMFRPGGRDDSYREDLEFLAATTFILRQNNDAFLDNDWTPFIGTTVDNVFVNRWNSGVKTIFTVLNMRSEGFDSKLFKVENSPGKHFVSLWNHENIKPVKENDSYFIPVRTEGWSTSSTGTRKEGSVDCVAEFPVLLTSRLNGDSIEISSKTDGKIMIWKGNPSYKTQFKEFKHGTDTVIRVKDLFGFYEGKIVVQLTDNDRIKDENILELKGGKPWLISKVTSTKKATVIPSDMLMVPGKEFSFDVSANDDFIPYPEINGKIFSVDSFLIDRYPVTNAKYYEFLNNSGYRPADTSNYLKHWQSEVYKQGQEKYPVVYVSFEDMMAYSEWAEKRLPTEAEWQLAAQGTDKRTWPWGNEFHGTYCNNSFTRPTPVDAFIKGQSPYGVIDMVGNVWQMTGDMYFNGTNYFSIIRGGSYYKPESSWWYIQGGPQQLDKTQMLLLVSPGFDRSSTVGFRCVKDIDSKSLKDKRQK
jgi:formylglycine-generating enzyme required for sulfatase activity